MPTVTLAAGRNGEVIAIATAGTEEEAVKKVREMVREAWLADALKEFTGK